MGGGGGGGGVSSDLPNYTTKEYKGICSTVFKDRYGNHNKSFNNERYKTDTELIVERSLGRKIKMAYLKNHGAYSEGSHLITRSRNEMKKLKLPCIRKTIY